MDGDGQGGKEKEAVVVIGGGSQLGRYLIPGLVDQGYRVVVTTRRPEEQPVTPGVEWVKADPVKERAAFVDAVRDGLDGRPMKGLINLLGSWMRGEPEKVLVDTSRWLSEALRPVADQGTPAVYISGTAVYGHRPGEVIDEGAPLRPRSQMGRWLVEAEQIWRQASHWSVSVLRFPHLYGGTVDRVMRLMAEGRFFIPGTGDNSMPHLHWCDAAQAVWVALEVEAGTYHWCDESQMTLEQWCRLITSSTGVEPLPRYGLEEALDKGAALVLGEHMRNPSFVEELFQVMSAELVLETAKTRETLGLRLQYPDPSVEMERLLSSFRASP